MPDLYQVKLHNPTLKTQLVLIIEDVVRHPKAAAVCLSDHNIQYKTAVFFNSSFVSFDFGSSVTDFGC